MFFIFLHNSFKKYYCHRLHILGLIILYKNLYKNKIFKSKNIII